MHRLASVLLLTLPLAACAAGNDGYPSLARRPAERVTGTAAPVAPVAELTPAPPSPELAGRLGQLIAQAQVADAKFTARAGETRRLVGAASGAAVASEPWSVATVALAALESARSDAMIALADLDALYAAERVAGGDGVATGEARDRVLTLVAGEDTVLADLRGRMRS